MTDFSKRTADALLKGVLQPAILRVKNARKVALAIMLFAAVISGPALLNAIAAAAYAIPQTMAYEGSLYDSNGNPLTGLYNMRYAIVVTSGSGSTAVWGPETHTSVKVTKGVFSVILGQMIPIPETVFQNTQLYLRIEVANPPSSSNYEVLSPVTEIVSVGNAFKAAQADVARTVQASAISAESLAKASVTKEAIATTNEPRGGQVLQWDGTALRWVSVNTEAGTFGDNITIGTNAMGSLEVIDHSIGTRKLATREVTTEKIAFSAITSQEVATAAVTRDAIATTNTATSGQVLKWDGANLIWADQNRGYYDDITITENAQASLEVKDLGITTTKLGTQAVTTEKIADSAITPVKMATASVTRDAIATSNTATTNQILKWDGSNLIWTDQNRGYYDDITITENPLASLEVKDLGISTTKLATSAVTTEKILDQNVTTDKIAPSAVTAEKMATDSVTTDAIVTSAVTTIKIADLNVTTAKIAPSAVTVDKMATASVTRDAIATSNTATTNQILKWDGSNLIWTDQNRGYYDDITITENPLASLEVKDLGISTAKLADSAVTAAKLAPDAVTLESINTINVPAGSGSEFLRYDGAGLEWVEVWGAGGQPKVDNVTIVVNASSSLEVKQLGITTPFIGDLAVTTEKLATSAVTAEKMATASVTRDAIATANTATTNQILKWDGSNMIWTDQNRGFYDDITITENAQASLEVKDLGISTTKLATSAVTTEKIADLAVTTSKIASSAVTADKILFGAVTRESIGTSNTPNTNDFLRWNGSALGWASALTDTDERTISRNIYGSIEVKARGISSTEIGTAAVTKDAIAAINQPTNNQVLKWTGSALQWTDLVRAYTDDVTIRENAQSSLEVKDLGISTQKLATFAVTAEKIGTSEIKTEKISDEAVTNAKIAPAAVTTDKIYPSAVTAPLLAPDAVTKESISSTNEPAAQQVLSWNGSELQWVTALTGLTAQAFIDDITIGVNSQGSIEVKDGGITALQLSSEAVTREAIAPAAVGSEEIDSYSITTSKIATSAVTAEKMATASVTKDAISTTNTAASGQILKWNGTNLIWDDQNRGYYDDITITENALASLEVKDLGISTAKLATAAVTSEKIGTGEVKRTNINNYAVGSMEIEDASVLTSKIQPSGVTSDRIAASAVGSREISATAVSAGTYGDSLRVAAFTVDEDGRIVSAESVIITGASPGGAAGGDLTGNYPAPTIDQYKVTTGKIATSAVTSEKIGTGEVKRTNIANYAVGTMEIEDSSVITSKILDSAVTSQKITEEAVGSREISPTGVISGVYGDSTHVGVFTVDEDGRLVTAESTLITGAAPVGSAGGDLTGNYPSPTIDLFKVTTGKIATSAVTSEKIGTGEVKRTNIENYAVGTMEIEDSSVITSKILDSAVISQKISEEAVGTRELAPTGIPAGSYGDSTHVGVFTVDEDGRLVTAESTLITGAAPVGPASGDLTGAYPSPTIDQFKVTTAKIATSAVTSEKIGAGEVKRVNILASSVGTQEIEDLSVINQKIATSAVTSDKIGAGEIKRTNIENYAVGTMEIEDSSVITSKILDSAVISQKISEEAVGTRELAATGIPAGSYGDSTHVGVFTVDEDGRLVTAESTLITGAAPVGPASGDLTGAYPSPTIDMFKVTTEKIATSAVTSEKINDQSVITSKIASSAVTAEKMALASVTREALATSNTPVPNNFLRWDGASLQWISIGQAIADNVTIQENMAGSLEVKDGGLTNSKLATGEFTNITAVGTLDSLSVSGTTEMAGDVVIGKTLTARPNAVVYQISAGTGITAAMLTNTIIRIEGSGGSVDITADPPVAPGTDGQMIIIKGAMTDTTTVKFNPGAYLVMSANYPFTVGRGDTLMLYYDAVESKWFEMSRNDNTL